MQQPVWRGAGTVLHFAAAGGSCVPHVNCMCSMCLTCHAADADCSGWCMCAGTKQAATQIATQVACPKNTAVQVAVPLGGSVLTSHSGQTCGTLPSVPEALQDVAQGAYTVTVQGERIDNHDTNITTATVSLEGGSNPTTFLLPKQGDNNWTAQTTGYTFKCGCLLLGSARPLPEVALCAVCRTCCASRFVLVRSVDCCSRGTDVVGSQVLPCSLA